MKTHIDKDAHTHTLITSVRTYTFRNLHRQTRTHRYTNEYMHNFTDIKHIYTNSRVRRYPCIKQTIRSKHTDTPHTNLLEQIGIKIPWCAHGAKTFTFRERD